MRLIELEPHWVSCLGAPADAKLGVSFLCPHCRATRLAVFFDAPICGNAPINIDAFKEAQIDCDHPHFEQWMNETHVGVKHWHREGDSLENLTLTPSIDASEFGHWHGFVTNGQAN